MTSEMLHFANLICGVRSLRQSGRRSEGPLKKTTGCPFVCTDANQQTSKSQQQDYLRELGCHFGQGYLFAKPLPQEEAERLWLSQMA